MSDLFQYVWMEFTSSLGPPPGRYPVRARDPASGRQDALLISLVGKPAARPLLLRRTRAVEPEPEVREVPVLEVTWVGTSDPIAGGRRGADHELAEMRKESERETLIAHALDVLNRAVRASAVVVGDPYFHEVSRLDPREIRIGVGPGEEIDSGQFRHALVCPPPPRGRTRLAERLKPSEAVLRALTGRDVTLDSELHLLRGLLDLDQGRDASALLELEAAVELLSDEQTRFPTDLVAQHLSAALIRAEALLPEAEAAGHGAPDPIGLLEVTLALLGAAAALRGAAVSERWSGDAPAAGAATELSPDAFR